jgi:hypothetical protein
MSAKTDFAQLGFDSATCRDCGEVVPVVHGRFAQHGQCPGWFAKVDDRESWEGSLESRFTDPRPDCPHPERWHSTDADSTELEVTHLVRAFVGALRPDVVVETGTAWGQTAIAIGKALDEGGYGGVLHTIEPDPERCASVRQKLGPLPVIVHETTSLEWIAGLEPGDTWFGGDQLGERPKIGFAWFDSLHHLRVPEFLALRPHMTKGAVVGFHDTGPHQGGLREEIEQLEEQGKLLPMFLPTPRGVCFAEVC